MRRAALLTLVMLLAVPAEGSAQVAPRERLPHETGDRTRFGTPPDASPVTGLRHSAAPMPGGFAASAPASSTTPLSPKPTGRPLTPQKSGGSGQTPAPGNWLSTLTALCTVLAVAAGLLLLFRKHLPARIRPLPPEVLQVLGRRVLEPRYAVHMMRCGSRVLLVGIGPDSMNTLAVIDDPVEVDHLVGLCRESEAAATGASFIDRLNQFSRPAAQTDDTAPPEADRLGTDAMSEPVPYRNTSATERWNTHGYTNRLPESVDGAALTYPASINQRLSTSNESSPLRQEVPRAA